METGLGHGLSRGWTSAAAKRWPGLGCGFFCSGKLNSSDEISILEHDLAKRVVVQGSAGGGDFHVQVNGGGGLGVVQVRDVKEWI
ncbi:hypothetical protein L1987_78898 [Smallanthus sonchifolius]|uniref:Uncharacterized protein n=1 Tax=Smallanthus sonchifolius TaxID=185202 RepID=A0ACB8ZD55_9ASTR|nr:hypothetical protein L1987_78898 [Smallanthus sonchifolius]